MLALLDKTLWKLRWPKLSPVALCCVCEGKAVPLHDDDTLSLACHDTDFEAVHPDGYSCRHCLTTLW
jgi:hypothetical protein